MGAKTSVVSELTRQRALTERFMLAALRAHDASTEALTASRRATFLASASRDLAMSLDDESARERIRRRALPREGSWCIVDVVEFDGALHRLPVAHPDAAQQDAAQRFADRWFPPPALGAKPNDGPLSLGRYKADNDAARRALGSGDLLVVPLVVRGRVLGAITFITRPDDAAFSPEEVSLASDLADLCALALDNERLYRQARELRRSADIANRAKSAFLGNMSHELMTPLNAIGGYVSLIEMGLRGAVTPEQLVDLARIRRNQEHLLAMITELLTFVQTETGRLEYRLSEIPVQRALDEVYEVIRGAVDDLHFGLLRWPARVDALVWADPTRVRQILLNLVTNALKYGTAAGGHVTLSVDTIPNAVFIHVADTGPGIPGEKLATIFDPFVQLASGLTERHGGVGLGLAISRDLARAMNGDLTVASTVGVGSRFTLRLPRSAPPNAKASPARASSSIERDRPSAGSSG
jgi:signal transduction histidine kinase